MSLLNKYFPRMIYQNLLPGRLLFTFLLITLSSLLLILTAHSQWVLSAELILYKIQPGISQVKFYGSSPFDKFTGTTSQITGFIEGDIPTLTEAPSLAVKAEVQVDAKSLNTGNNNRDKKMRETLEVEKYPFITFQLSQANFIEKSVDTNISRYKVEGTLSIHGVERPITVDVESKMEANRMTLSGEISLDITDYKIKPPRVPVLAFLKMDKNVTIDFTLIAEADSF